MPPRLPHLVALALLGSASAAAAQTPPIKPGLWETRSERVVDGKKVERVDLKRLSPQVRTAIEARMKSNGIALGKDGVNRVCLSTETLDPSRWRDGGTGCKTEHQSRTGKVWKWRTTCTEPAFQSDGEANFATPESYTVETTMTTAMRGVTKTSQVTVHSKWLGADCGDLKPFAPAR